MKRVCLAHEQDLDTITHSTFDDSTGDTAYVNSYQQGASELIEILSRQ
jgi:hypothetical protein